MAIGNYYQISYIVPASDWKNVGNGASGRQPLSSLLSFFISIIVFRSQIEHELNKRQRIEQERDAYVSHVSFSLSSVSKLKLQFSCSLEVWLSFENYGLYIVSRYLNQKLKCRTFSESRLLTKRITIT